MTKQSPAQTEYLTAKAAHDQAAKEYQTLVTLNEAAYDQADEDGQVALLIEWSNVTGYDASLDRLHQAKLDLIAWSREVLMTSKKTRRHPQLALALDTLNKVQRYPILRDKAIDLCLNLDSKL